MLRLKIKNGAVIRFNKIADKFAYNFLTKEGESVEEAKENELCIAYSYVSNKKGMS